MRPDRSPAASNDESARCHLSMRRAQEAGRGARGPHSSASGPCGRTETSMAASPMNCAMPEGGLTTWRVSAFPCVRGQLSAGSSAALGPVPPQSKSLEGSTPHQRLGAEPRHKLPLKRITCPQILPEERALHVQRAHRVCVPRTTGRSCERGQRPIPLCSQPAEPHSERTSVDPQMSAGKARDMERGSR